MSLCDPDEIPAELRDLIDKYCSGLIDEPVSGNSRHSCSRPTRAAILRRILPAPHGDRVRRPRQAGDRSRRGADHGPTRNFDGAWRPVAVGSNTASRQRGWSRPSRWAVRRGVHRLGGGGLRRLGVGLASSSPVEPHGCRVTNVAWLVNAQDCLWSQTDQRPGRDMQAGKPLRLDRGLAEIEFDCGARVILQGPAGLELLSGRSARLLQGVLTAHVPPRARGFTVLTPHNRVVDLGTEFGLAVDEAGAATVRVFTGEVQAFPLASGSARESDLGVTILQDQAVRLDGRTMDRTPADRVDGPPRYVRTIEPQPVFAPRTLRFEFLGPSPGTLRDAEGRGIGLTHRLPGTGGKLPGSDPNLRLRPERQALELTTTRSDINTQDRMPTGEYLGVRLSDLGFTGAEDFEIRVTLPNIPGLSAVGQFGLYAGTGSDRNIRGGLICWPRPDTYRLFLVNNFGGRDSDLYEVGLTTSGDDLRLALRRLGGRYSLVVDNLTRNSSSTLAIAHPAFLDGKNDLYLGLFGANTQSDACKTLTIRDLSVTVWTAQSGTPTMVGMGPPGRYGPSTSTP